MMKIVAIALVILSLASVSNCTNWEYAGNWSTTNTSAIDAAIVSTMTASADATKTEKYNIGLFAKKLSDNLETVQNWPNFGMSLLFLQLLVTMLLFMAMLSISIGSGEIISNSQDLALFQFLEEKKLDWSFGKITTAKPEYTLTLPEPLQPALSPKQLKLPFQLLLKLMPNQEQKRTSGQLPLTSSKPLKNMPPQPTSEVPTEPILPSFPKIRPLSSTVLSATPQMVDTVLPETSILEHYSCSKQEIMPMLLPPQDDCSAFKSISKYIYPIFQHLIHSWCWEH